MPELGNPRWEKFAQLKATGMTHCAAYIEAGYTVNSKNRNKVASQRGGYLIRKPLVIARVAELEEELRDSALANAAIDREYVVKNLKENSERAQAAVPVIDRQGNATGEYKQDTTASNRALELLGKEVGMFKERFDQDGLDEKISKMTTLELRQQIRAAATAVGLRMVEMDDKQLRTFILAHAPELDSDALKQALMILEATKHRKMAAYLPYPKQAEFHRLGTEKRERMLMAGNQLGKTAAAGHEVAYHLTGLYPEWWEGKRYAGPIICWVGNTTNEMVRDNPQRTLMGEAGNWGTGTIPRSHIMKKPTMSRGFPDMIDTVPIKHVTGGVSILQFKAYKQGREAWAGRSVDLIWCDEEPDKVVYGEILARVTATGGIIMLTMTPLLGMSEVVSKFYPEPDTAQRSLTMFEIWDVGHLTLEEKNIVVAGYPEHEREARSRGLPMLGEGMIFKIPPSMIRCEPFKIPQHWRVGGGLDFGYGDHPFAATKVAYDIESDTFYVTDEFKDKSNSPAIHCAALKAWNEDTKYFWPHDGNRQWGDSGPVATVYRDGGLKMHFEHSHFLEGGYSPEACCTEVMSRMQTGRFKVFESCGSILQEISTYHRKDGKIVALNDDLISAMFKTIMMMRFLRTAETAGLGRQTQVIGDYDELSGAYLEDEYDGSSAT